MVVVAIVATFDLSPACCGGRTFEEGVLNIQELADQLRRAYDTADEGKKVVAIHLFGIRHADQLNGVSCKEFAVRAGIHESYGTELRKGVNLAEYVSVR
jgi:hypothetical protein